MSRYIVISPHLDDAVLSAWRFLRDQPCTVVTVFAGPPAPGTRTRFDRLAGWDDSSALVHERQREDREALCQVGATVVHLDYLDNQYRPGSKGITGNGLGAPSAAEVIAQLEEDHLLRENEMVLGPAAIGEHADHVISRDVMLALAVAGHSVALYADLPYASRFGWPKWVDPSSSSTLDPSVDWEASLSAVRRRAHLEPVVNELTEAERTAKLADVTRYRSQFPVLNGAAIGILTAPQTFRYEVTWHLEARQ